MASTTIATLRVPGRHRRARVAFVAALALALASGAPSAAAAAAAARPVTATVCAPQATLFETPGGAAVGILHRGDRVRVAGKGPRGTWWRVVASFGTRGWLRGSSICGRHR